MNDNLSKKSALYEEERKSQAKFNTVTHSSHVENQNQTFNVKKEALGPNAKR